MYSGWDHFIGKNNVMIMAAGLLCFSIALFIINSEKFHRGYSTGTIVPCTDLSKHSTSSSATSGSLFVGSKIVEFDKSGVLFNGVKKVSAHQYNQSLGNLMCARWSVVTTIFEPTDAVKIQASLKNWCIVVVGDKKGPNGYVVDHTDNFVFLGVKEQEILATEFVLARVLPWNHFGRKNIGYMYAIMHGAKVIWDFDDDNMLLSTTPYFNFPSFNEAIYNMTDGSADTRLTTVVEPLITSLPSLSTGTTPSLTTDFNPYPFMGAESSPCWPRGFPLDHIKLVNTSLQLVEKRVPFASIGIVQSLANHDPDMDAIYRLTQPVPFSFKSNLAKFPNTPVLVPSSVYSPYNAQATLHFYPALWSLLLPVSVHGRVSDIWRGYFFQRLARDIGIQLAFCPPLVIQYRNVHNYLADFDSEDHLYKRSGKLLEQLNEWQLITKTLPGRIEELWILLYEHGYIKLEDVHLVQAWIDVLFEIGYVFPKLKHA